ncbi:hypothetical protein OO012_03030 [Rhodobacteraceae bacterium KMM 6894]|nr:hypothetical protein [Rhodobacteraceae bacterium KMM 6894]
MKPSLVGLTMAVSLFGAHASAGNLSDPAVSPQVVAADAIDHSSKNMQEMLALLTVTTILTLVMTAH